MPDKFASHADGLTTPAQDFVAITPNDAADLADRPKALYIGGAGTLVLRNAAGASVAFAVQAGSVLPVRPNRVMATGTTATGIVGLY